MPSRPGGSAASAIRRALALACLTVVTAATPLSLAQATSPTRGESTGVRLLLVGLDGADWQIAGPLIEAGRMPNLANLRGRGAWTDLRSASPMLSPLLWTSIATGKAPADHGIIDFLVVDPGTGQRVPISSTFRKTKAIWNIYSEAGRSVDFIGWWATWPAESIRGHMISDRLAYSLFGYQSRPEDAIGLVSPPDYLDTARGLRFNEDRITLDDLRRFAPFSADELRAAREKLRSDPSQAYDDPINHLIRILASTRTYHAIALDLIRKGKSDLLSVYYQGIDEVSHRFAHYMPPRLPWVDQAAFEKHKNIVARFYEYQDALLGELVAAAGRDVTVAVVSDHGFLNGSDRPDFPPDIEAKAGRWHRLYGVLVLAGPAIRPGRLEPAGLYDLTPTLMYLSGLPIPTDMAGRPILDAVEPAFRGRVRLHTVASYETEDAVPSGRPKAPPGGSAHINEEILAKLRSLGYIASTDIATGPEVGDGEAPATLTNMLNLAVVQFNEGNLAESERLAREITQRRPNYVEARILLAQVLEAEGRIPEAREEARTALNMAEQPPEALVERYARLSRKMGDVEGAKAYFLRQAQLRPGRGEPWLGLGVCQTQSNDLEGAEASFLRALEMNPRSTAAVTGLYDVYERGNRSRQILGSLEKAVQINPDSAAHRTLLGMIYAKEGNSAKAEAELRKALELDPERDLALASLGDVLAQRGQVEEAKRLLEKAVARNGDQPEVRMSLARLYAKLNRMGEATRQMTEAVRIDPTSASAHGQLGMILMMQFQRERAVVEVERALDLDPGMYELRLHLAVMYYELKKYRECESALLAAARERPDDPEPHRLLAGLYQETGRTEEAQKALARLRQLTNKR